MEFIKNTIQKMNEMFETDIGSFNKKLVNIAKSTGGKAYLVGGAVRDELLGVDSKDFDYVITKIPLEDLAKKLQQEMPEAKINEVGKSFGIIKLSIGNDEFDIAIPRADIDRGNVKTDPNIPIEEDLNRRDLVINSMAKDLETGEIINPTGYDGQSDIKNKILRSVGNPKDRFREDPLRILRVLQFSSRFGFDIEPNTLQGIKENIDLLKNVSIERFKDEFFKGWTKGNSDTNKFFNLLYDTNIGILLFGKDFSPIALDKKDLPANEFFLAQYIAAFLHGGDYTKLSLSTDDQDFIKVARWFDKAISKGLDINTIKEIYKHSDKFNFIKKVFGKIDSKTRGVSSNFIEKLLSKPLIPRQDSNKPLETWELPVTGGQLIDLSKKIGCELKGKHITDTVLNLIKAYQSGSITLADSEEETLKTIETYLKNNVLKEHFVKNQQSLDIIKKRISNILQN